LVVALVATLLVAGGCVSGNAKKRQTVPGKAPCYPADSHLVFNPAESHVPLVDVPRSDWPVASGSRVRGDTIEFSERLTDRQGQFGHDRDYLVRRFRSVRTGRIER